MVSIIVPVYNTPIEYLKKCIESLVSQTYRDIEILLIDDGSQKQVADFVSELPYRDGRIVVFHKENGGVSSARNLGLQKARGKYISFVDSDDWVESDFIELLVTGIETYGTDLSIVNFTYENGQQHKVKNGKNKVSPQFFSVQELWKQLLYYTEIGGFLCNKLFRKELITQRLNEKLHYSEDFVFTAFYAEDVQKAVFIDKGVYHYRQGQNNASSDLTYNDKIFSLIYSYGILEEIYCRIAPEVLPGVRRNRLKIALYLRARYKICKADAPEQYEKLEKVIHGYIGSVLKSEISFSAKVNILLTWMFPTLLFRVKNMILRRAI